MRVQSTCSIRNHPEHLWDIDERRKRAYVAFEDIRDVEVALGALVTQHTREGEPPRCGLRAACAASATGRCESLEAIQRLICRSDHVLRNYLPKHYKTLKVKHILVFVRHMDDFWRRRCGHGHPHLGFITTRHHSPVPAA